MNTDRLKELLEQYFENKIQSDDCNELLNYIDEDENSLLLSNLIDEYFQTYPTILSFPENQKDKVFKQIIERTKNNRSTIKPKIRTMKTRYVSVSVTALILVVSVLFLMVFNNKKLKPSFKQKIVLNEINLPETNSATFTFPDGRIIEVNDTLNGVISQENGITLGKDSEGNLYYRNATISKSSRVELNSFSTAKGNTFQFILPDGTKVYLNTSTTIRFPEAFSNTFRKVELSGEAYFEVAHHSEKPFKIEVNGSTIEVLGTKFNVSSYKDDPQVITSLIEGSVKIYKNNRNTILKPNEQATVNSQTGKISKTSFNIRAIQAWRKGYFYFEEQSIESMMKSLSAWYDIDEINIVHTSTDTFSGTFKRSKGLSQLLKHLENISDLHFIIEGRSVTIMK